jgi:hypothetical protein
MQKLCIRLTAFAVVIAGKRALLMLVHMFERTLVQVVPLFLLLKSFRRFIIYDSWTNNDNHLSQGLVVFVHGQKLGMLFQSVLGCTMVRSVSSQESRQIMVTLFLHLRPFYHLLLLNFFLLLPELEDGFFILLYSFYHDFIKSSSYRKRKTSISFFP